MSGTKGWRRRVLAWCDDRGSVQILFGIILPILIGFAGLGLDGGFWMMERTRLQAVTDSAAISGAHTLYLGGSKAQVSSDANTVIGKLYGAGAAKVTLVAHTPPTSGSQVGSAQAVEIKATARQPLFFSRIYKLSEVNVTARSVAVVSVHSDNCVLALAPTLAKAVELTGSSLVNLGCGVASNSNSSESVYASGNTNLAATTVSAVGDIFRGDSATLTSTAGPPKPHSPAIIDPYGPAGRNLQVPATPTACADRNLKVQKNTKLKPGRYCGGIVFQGGKATLDPGTYIFDGGDFDARAGAQVSGDGVTIVLTGSGNSYGGISVNGNASLSLHAPTSGAGPFNGVLFFQDRNAPTYKGNQIVANKLNGTSDLDLSGAIYLPSQELVFSGGTTFNISCLQLIGFKVTFTGNGRITNTCNTQSGVQKIARISVDLVE